jgi:hypothetical protein
MAWGILKNRPETGNRKPETGNRKPETGNRKPETGSVFGLSPEWLLYNGQPIASAMVLSHDHELTRLAESTPAAAETAVVAGDPAYDRMLRSKHLRRRYRQALGLEPGQKLVTISTTWWKRSLMGSWPSLFREVMACLPRDEYRVAALIHPNIWHGHGPWQVHTWLADCLRSGLILPAPVEGWQATLIASDLIIGDHGATTCYAAALDLPVVLAAFPDDDVAAGSAGDQLGKAARRLNRHESLRTQIEQTLREHQSGTFDPVRDLVTSCPGEAARRLRALFYSHLLLPEPSTEPAVPVIPVENVASAPQPQIHADHVVCTQSGLRGNEFTISRYPADAHVDRSNASYLDAAFLVAHEDHPQQSLVEQAAVVIIAPALDGSDPTTMLADALRRHRGATLVAVPLQPGAVVLSREGMLVRVSGGDPEISSAMLYEWLVTGEPPDAPLNEATVTIGTDQVVLSLKSTTVEPIT